MKDLKNISIIAELVTEIIYFIFAIAFVVIMAILTKYSFSWKTVICIYFVIYCINGFQNRNKLLQIGSLFKKLK